ncbi:ReoY family proteolytic degradation factor [Salirhabdus salicampi]|uniref:ReoY family proteolytic degradation factor n=1 Tax=Salirhabdus salicampi TaxID=476102 RepID=UPI00266CE940|nr:ReoY family proteolytic degradation factor [Salirhabdus salicampi]
MTISVLQKKRFIQWFLNNYQLKRRECVWILNYVMNHEHVLKHVHFVREARVCPKGIIISAKCVDDPPFRFYKEQIMTSDPEKSFHDIRLNDHESIFIQLNYKKANQCPRYAGVMEENPYLPEDYYITEKDQQAAEKMMNHVLYNFQVKKIQAAIDQALDDGDKEKFHMLIEQLNQLTSEKFTQQK